ncbi:MAG: exodeoxyribonuclease V subunit alpha [Actinomycetia bacterium]|nr:exodeoxyribonuclease V subunit alpha [Actinomycetes bacterium]
MNEHQREPLTEHDWRLATGATGALATLNQAGILEAADLQVARTLARIARETDADVVLAAALATRAVRTGSVAVDLAAVPQWLAAAPTSIDLPDPQDWLQQVAASRLVAEGALVVDQGMVYLQRYHHQEVQVVQDLRTRAALEDLTIDEEVLAAGLTRVFPGAQYAEQRAAAEIITRARTSVLTGGPGTGKTTTVAGVLALLAEQQAAHGARPIRIGLAAPTGKAAARMSTAVAGALAQILDRTADSALREVIEPLTEVEPMTVHRLLGWRPGSRTRFRHHRMNRLPYDVVLVDEASMVSLTHMARLLEALRPTARLILVGDADQLTSVDAGAVLADLVAGAESTDDPPLALARLRTVHRFGATIGALADALRRGDADAVVQSLSSGSDEVVWVQDAEPTAYVRTVVMRHAHAVLEAATAGDAPTALAALARHRLLCAHRSGDFGVATWNRNVENWLAEETGLTFYDPMYLGRPLLVTANDYATGVLNGDAGVVVASTTPDGRAVRMAVIEGATGAQRFAPSRLGDIETMHAMTIHKAQGSQAEEITVLLPDETSALLTRELFYTAVTRAEQRVRIVGSEAVIRAAVERRVVRASGLRQRLVGAQD